MSKEKEDIECVEAERGGKGRKDLAPLHHLREAGAGGQAWTCCVPQLPRKHCLFTYRLSSLRVALKNARANREQKVWSLGRPGVRGGGAGAVATPKPTPCQRRTCHPWSTAACKDALSSAKPHWNVSLSHDLLSFCQKVSKHRRDSLCPTSRYANLYSSTFLVSLG